MLSVDERSMVARVTALLSGAPTELRRNIDSSLNCQCKIHTPYVPNGNEGVGCDGVPLGNFRPIRALREDAVRYCHAEEGQIVLDVSCAKTAYTDVERYSYLKGGYGPEKRFCKGVYAHPNYFGPGYCYTAAIEPTARVRAARINGPSPLVVDVIRLLRVFGLSDVGSYRFERVGKNLCHLAYDGRVFMTGFSLMQNLLDFVEEHGKNVRMGALVDVDDDSEDEFVDVVEDSSTIEVSKTVEFPGVSVSGVSGTLGVEVKRENEDSGLYLSGTDSDVHIREQLAAMGLGNDVIYKIVQMYAANKFVAKYSLGEESVVRTDYGLHRFIPVLSDDALDFSFFASFIKDNYGIYIPSLMVFDLRVVFTVPRLQNEISSLLRRRFRMWANFGDSCMKLAVLKRCMLDDKDQDSVSKLVQNYLSNASLAKLFHSWGCDKLLAGDLKDLSGHGKGDMIEAFVALIYIYCGFEVGDYLVWKIFFEDEFVIRRIYKFSCLNGAAKEFSIGDGLHNVKDEYRIVKL